MPQKRKEAPQTDVDSFHDTSHVLGRPTAKKLRQVTHFVGQYKLNAEQERRLGKACDATTWAIRIAQSSVKPSCLIIRAIVQSDLQENEWSLLLDTSDRCPLKVVLAGSWVRAVAARFHIDDQLIKHQPFLISSCGASLQEYRDSVAFAAEQPTLHILDLSDLELGEVLQLKHGWIEADAIGQPSHHAYRERRVDGIASSSGTIALSPPQASSSGPDSVAPLGISAKSNLQRTSSSACLSPSPPPPPQEYSSLQKTFESSAGTPPWASTPSPKKSRLEGDIVQSMRSGDIDEESSASGSNRPRVRSSSVDATEKRALSVRRVGRHEFKPISMLDIDPLLCVSTIGIVERTKQMLKAGGGKGDWMINLTLRDIFPLGDQGKSSSINCNIFSSEADSLPDLHVNDVLALTDVKVRAYQGARLATGYIRKFGWTRLSNRSGAITRTPDAGFAPSAEVDEELKLLHSYAKRQVGEGAVGEYTKSTQSNSTQRSGKNPGSKRSLERICDIQTRVHFFDLHALIVYMWDGERPYIAVTDFTFNPEVDPKHDKYLPGAVDGQGPKQAKGGHVLYIFLWGTNIKKTEMWDLRAGKYVRLQNIRAKVSPHGFLEGSMNSEQKDGMECFKVNELPDTYEPVQAMKSRALELLLHSSSQ